VTLRLRLLLLLVAIVAAGLVISDVVTYTSLRSFLTARVDQQLEGATYPVERALLYSEPGSGASAPRRGGSPGSATPSFPGEFPGARGSRGAGREVLVPPGTFGELRNPGGAVVEHVFFTYGAKSPTAPVIPPSLPGSGLHSTTDLFFSTSSPGGLGYRALAQPLSKGQGTIVVAQPLTDISSTLGHLLFIELLVSGLVLVGLGALAWVMVRRDMRPLEEMAETAGAIAGGDLSQRVSPVSSGSEVGRLSLAFNTMIGEIEEAFASRAASEDRLRRFLADASHELRTPLTSILGYAEIFDLGVSDRPADLATSMHHIKDEAARMGTLVDDLFLLAQLDHARPLVQEPLDLASVAQQSVDATRIMAPDREIAFLATEPVVMVGDSRRMRQVVDNLLVNAVMHAPEVAGIAVGVRTDGDAAVVVVHDDGPGIDPENVPRIFEPFYRSDPSRARDTGGAGLGLAIVSAIVEAHQGQIVLLDGEGTTFEVRIPVVPPARTGPREPVPDRPH
jgi:two-component system OmpR family sensor kinase